MSIQVHIETLKLHNAEKGCTPGTVEVTLGKVRREVRCTKWERGLVIYGLAVRYPTGKKVWHGRAEYDEATGGLKGLRGGLDHRSRFAHISLLGFYDDYSSEQHSQR